MNGKIISMVQTKMRINQNKTLRRPAWILAIAGMILCASAAWPQSAEDLRLTVGKSVVIDYPNDIRQISTSSPDVVDASPVTGREILLHGKGLGNATVVVWSRTGERSFYNVTVDLNLDPLRKILKDTFPNEQITPDSSRDSLSLNGRVSSKEVSDRAVALSTGFAKTVVNNLELAAPPIAKQILLRVKFAELDRTREEQFGVNLVGYAGQTLMGTSTGQFGGNPIVSSTGNGATRYTIGEALNIFAFDPRLNLAAFIKALQANSVLQILADRKSTRLNSSH